MKFSEQFSAVKTDWCFVDVILAVDFETRHITTTMTMAVETAVEMERFNRMVNQRFPYAKHREIKSIRQINRWSQAVVQEFKKSVHITAK